MHRRPRFVAAVMVLVLGLGLVGVPSAVAVEHPLESTTLITLNMQGASSNSDSKWTNTVQRLSAVSPIVLLQEVGPGPPPESVRQPDIEVVTQGANGTQTRHTVLHHTWRVGGGRHVDNGRFTREVYYLQTQDPNGPTAVGGRVNIAIVLWDEPDEVLVVANPIDAGRSSLGIRYGNNWFFTVHGLSGSGGDSAELLNAIDDRVELLEHARDETYDVTVGGDFNVNPAVLQRRAGFPPNMYVHNPGQGTHQGGNELDYFVTTNPGVRPRVTVRSETSSDHLPVQWGAMAAAAGDYRFATNRTAPVGDSITEGWGSSNESGYRERLQSDLAGMTTEELLGGGSGSGAVFTSTDFVGERRHGKRGDPDHMGYPGDVIDTIRQKSLPGIKRLQPNIVTLLAGTNDMILDVDVARAPDRLNSFISAIFEASPAVTIIVGTLPTSADDGYNARMSAYNRVVRDMVRGRSVAGDRLVLVDLSAVTRADIADHVHPNDNGYAKIADAFAEGVKTALVRRMVKEARAGATEPDVGNDHKRYVQFANLDGDSFDDYLAVDPDDGSVHAWINDDAAYPGDHWIDRGIVASGTNTGVGVGGREVRFADLNGDGRDDYLAVDQRTGSVHAWINDGAEYAGDHWVDRGIVASGTNTGVGVGGREVRFADLNGDRRDDYLAVDQATGQVYAWINDGAESAGDHWIDRGVIASGTDTGAGRNGRYVDFADMDNDKRADYVVIDPADGAVHIWINHGADQPGDHWLDYGSPVFPVNAGVGIDQRRLLLSDVSGDRRADYLAVDPRNGSVRALMNNYIPGGTWLDRGIIASGTNTGVG